MAFELKFLHIWQHDFGKGLKNLWYNSSIFPLGDLGCFCWQYRACNWSPHLSSVPFISHLSNKLHFIFSDLKVWKKWVEKKGKTIKKSFFLLKNRYQNQLLSQARNKISGCSTSTLMHFNAFVLSPVLTTSSILGAE